jgi:hypothetical protein
MGISFPGFASSSFFDPFGTNQRVIDPLGIVFREGEKKLPTPLPPAPLETDPEIEAARQAEAASLRKKRGRKSTILTSPGGSEAK